jgi:lipoprotein signal peptidase
VAFTFAALAILFQPFLRIALGRTIWNIGDVIVAIGLILLIVKGKEKKGK